MEKIMNTSSLVKGSDSADQSVEKRWVALYLLLLPLATRWVYAAKIYSWNGQENDIAWDIVQVTIQRTFEYDSKAQYNNTPIGSYQGLSIRIAKNYFQDLRRKDSRLLPLYRDGYSPVENTRHDEKDVADVILDQVYEDWLFQQVAKEIASFPPKLRTAMLIEIASRMEFGLQPSSLQAAFLKVGIRLREYANQLPQDPILRTRHASLVSLGYKRLAMKIRTREDL